MDNSQPSISEKTTPCRSPLPFTLALNPADKREAHSHYRTTPFALCKLFEATTPRTTCFFRHQQETPRAQLQPCLWSYGQSFACAYALAICNFAMQEMPMHQRGTLLAHSTFASAKRVSVNATISALNFWRKQLTAASVRRQASKSPRRGGK